MPQRIRTNPESFNKEAGASPVNYSIKGYL